MERLIELLNERSKTVIKGKSNWTDVYDEEWVYFVNLFDRDMTMEIEDVISKRNWFIQWLVENEKIDTNNLSLKAFKTIFGGNWFIKVSDLEVILMLLSISDSPIDDLISYLK